MIQLQRQIKKDPGIAKIKADVFLQKRQSVFLAAGFLIAVILFSQAFTIFVEKRGSVLGISVTEEKPRGNISSFIDAVERPLRSEAITAVQEQNHPIPGIKARSYIVYEPVSDTILFSHNVEERLKIASLTKLMTALVASEDPAFQTPVTIMPDDTLNVSPNLKVAVGDRIAPGDLVKAMLVGSANDAAHVLANHFPNRSEFVARMNNKAKNLAMNNTNFSNPTGFDSEYNYSTASDVFQLVRESLQVLPYAEVWAQRDYAFTSNTGKRYAIKNSSDLAVSDSSVRLIKTGYSRLAQENMVSEVRNPDGRRVIVIVLNTGDRDGETRKLADQAFLSFSW